MYHFFGYDGSYTNYYEAIGMLDALSNDVPLNLYAHEFHSDGRHGKLIDHVEGLLEYAQDHRLE
jgi:hypothetical protein